MTFFLSEALRNTFNRTVRLLAVRVQSKQCNAVFNVLRRKKKKTNIYLRKEKKERDETNQTQMYLFLALVYHHTNVKPVQVESIETGPRLILLNEEFKSTTSGTAPFAFISYLLAIDSS
jgi:hypothetical protein